MCKKFLCFFIVNLLTTISWAGNHAVTQEMVDHIKSKTNEWLPKPVEENPLKDLSDDELKKKMGNHEISSTGLGKAADSIKGLLETVKATFTPLSAPVNMRHRVFALPASFDART